MSINLQTLLATTSIEEHFHFDFRILVSWQLEILKKYEVFLPLKLRNRARQILKEGDIFILNLHSSLTHMEINSREFIAKLTNYLDNPDAMWNERISKEDKGYIVWLYEQQSLGNDDLIRAVNLFSRLYWDERECLKRHLMVMKIDEQTYANLWRRFMSDLT